MIITEKITIDGKEFNRTYSSSGLFMIRDGFLYAEAVELPEYTREYTETDKYIRNLEEEATVEDYQQALERMGVKV